MRLFSAPPPVASLPSPTPSFSCRHRSLRSRPRHPRHGCLILVFPAKLAHPSDVTPRLDLGVQFNFPLVEAIVVSRQPFHKLTTQMDCKIKSCNDVEVSRFLYPLNLIFRRDNLAFSVPPCTKATLHMGNIGMSHIFDRFGGKGRAPAGGAEEDQLFIS